ALHRRARLRRHRRQRPLRSGARPGARPEAGAARTLFMEGKTMNAAIAFLVSMLGQTLYILLLLGAALALLIGSMLLVDSQRVLRWNEYLNRWISTGQSSRVLDQSRDLKRIVYRRHRLAGLVLRSEERRVGKGGGVWVVA